MGICLGWEQRSDIPARAFAGIGQDMMALETAYRQEIQTRLARETGLLGRLGRMLDPGMGEDLFKIGRVDECAIEVHPSQSMREAGMGPWRVEPGAGDYWVRQHGGGAGMYQGEMLMAALLLVERHCPGVVVITQDDYEPGCWEQAAAWMEPALGGKLRRPARR